MSNKDQHNEEAIQHFIECVDNGMIPILSIFMDTDKKNVQIAQSVAVDPKDVIHILKDMLTILETQVNPEPQNPSLN